MKLLIKSFTVLFAATTMFACNNGDDKTTKTETNSDSVSADKSGDKKDAMDTSKNSMNTAAASPEQDFINFAVPANMKELAWLKAGMAMGTSKELKQHASMMIKDHDKIGATVKDYLSKHTSITMPTVDTAGVVDINDKSGADWDKAWVDKMVDDHQALLDKLNSSKTEVKDADLNKIIMNTIPTVQSHLSMVKMMQDKMKK